MRFRFAVAALFAAGLTTFGMTYEVAACGACLAPPSQTTVVTGHRMALSVSPKQTVLWDQIEYSGAPEQFAWVLPVKPGAIVQLSSDAWFDTLDSATTTQIFQPQITCENGSSGPSFGCGSSDSLALSRGLEDSANGTGGGPAVTVVSRGSVGPYSTVTLSTDTPGVLNQWLTDSGFAIDPASQPIVDAYVAEGFDFIALKLKHDANVQAMKPVRVVQPGADPSLPLRMVSIGTGSNVALTLFLISEGRWEAKNFSNAIVPTNLIAWDFKDSSSNYGVLRQTALEQNDGKTWLTTFAMQGGLLQQIQGIPGFMSGIRTYSSPSSQGLADTMASAYIQQALGDGQLATDDCVARMAQLASAPTIVSNPCDLGKPYDDPSCGAVGANEIDARNLVCGLGQPEPLDDVAVALNGLHPKDVWLTRIEANLPHAALANDLIVQPSATQTKVDNLKFASVAKNVEVVCGSGGSIVPLGANSDKSGPRGRENLVVLVGLGLLSLAAFARRRFVPA